jgi:multisubunit Na+/H+ antiporter MnhF subunit
MTFFSTIFFLLIIFCSGLLLIRKNILNKLIIINLITSFIVCLICVVSFSKNSTNYIDISFFYILLGASVPLAVWIYYKKLDI